MSSFIRFMSRQDVDVPFLPLLVCLFSTVDGPCESPPDSFAGSPLPKGANRRFRSHLPGKKERGVRG